MTRYVIEFQAQPGKGNEAMRLFREIKDYFKTAHQKTLDVFYQAFGTPGTFQVTMDFENLGELEALAKTIRRDVKYQSLAEESLNIFTADSFGTTVYYQI